MIDSEVINSLALVSARVNQLVGDYSAKVLALAEAYRYLGKDFVFGVNPTLDERVNRLLVELSDAVLTDMVYEAKKALEKTEEEDSDAVIAWAKERIGAQDTADKYSSHLKYLLEGWLAIGFYNKISKGRLETLIMSYMENPYITPLWRDAFADGATYAAEIIRTGGYRWGSGTPISPAKGLSILEKHYITTAYQKGVINSFVRTNAIGYTVHRGSSYDCPECDEVCAYGVYPLTEVVLPVHPNCMCYAVPVFMQE